MSEGIECTEHGRQPSAFVCVHILDSLDDETPCGFKWGFDDGDYHAVCDACAALSDEAWERQSGSVIRLICLGCFKRAGRMNDVVVELPQ